MKKRIYLGLFLAGLALGLAILSLRPYTGYMDADYYYAGARTLFGGNGFFDYTLWNYLSHPMAIPYPANTYWMPLATILAWCGMKLAGTSSLFAARLPFVFLYAFIPPAVAALSYRIFQNQHWAIISGLLALACGYFLKFITEPDGFGVMILAGAGVTYLLVSNNPCNRLLHAFLLGLIAGVIQMTRADGSLWLILLLAATVYLHEQGRDARVKSIFISMAGLFAGYLVISSGWYIRNLQAFGSLMPPGGLRAFYLNSYDQLFSYPPESLNLSNWLQGGLSAILLPRLNALGLNLVTVVAVFGMVVLVPAIILGIKTFLSKRLIRFWAAAFIIVFSIMTLVFPFVGARGGLLHSGAIFLPGIWLIIPAGNQRLVDWLRKRAFFSNLSENMFHYAVVFVLVLVSGFVLVSEMTQPASITQANTWQDYRRMDAWLQNYKKNSEYRVMVNNPLAYYAVSGREAVVIPYGDENTILAVAKQYQINYLILDESHIPQFNLLYQSPESAPAGFHWLGDVNHMQIFQLGE
jgi:hypothetical protein